ncbi:MAG: acyl-CoA dehydrogenase family protein, partial [Planctomycetes bacterium]|nr:acyl-CoA dehydrogenase family protein [Planctomycetota bacterium]
MIRPTEEHVLLRDLARQFTDERIRPAAAEIERT